jgi:hypothetical protein
VTDETYSMDEQERLIADDVYAAIQTASARSPRAAQTHFGISSLGWCAEQMRRTLDGQVQDDTDHLSAFIGTAIGDHVERAFKAQHPEAIIQAEVHTTLVGDSGITYELTGHPDILMPGRVYDIKTDFGLGVVERTGPSQQQRWQRALYAKAAWEMGLLGDLPLEEVEVGNVWIDRGATDKRCLVQLEPFDPADIDAATFWVDDVVYSWLNKQVARKEPPRNVCYATCGYALDCRGIDTDVQGLITDERQLTAVEMYVEGGRLEREAKRLKAQAKIALDGVSGSTGDFTVRWISVNGAHIEFDRKPSMRLDIRELH